MRLVWVYVIPTLLLAGSLLMGCSERPDAQKRNQEFLSAASLDLLFYYPDSTKVLDQAIFVQRDSLALDTTVTSELSYRQLSVGRHNFVWTDEDGVLYWTSLILRPGRNPHALPVNYRLRNPSLGSLKDSSKVDVLKWTKMIFDAPIH